MPFATAKNDETLRRKAANDGFKVASKNIQWNEVTIFLLLFSTVAATLQINYIFLVSIVQKTNIWNSLRNNDSFCGMKRMNCIIFIFFHMNTARIVDWAETKTQSIHILYRSNQIITRMSNQHQFLITFKISKLSKYRFSYYDSAEEQRTPQNLMRQNTDWFS